jgi:hypothetical protein
MKTTIKTMLAPALALTLALLLWVALTSLGASAQQAGGQYVVMHTTTITNTAGTAVAPNALGDSFAALTVQAAGMVSGTLHFEGTINGSTFVALVGQNVSTGATATTTTAAGIYRLNVVGLSSVRVRVSGITTTTTDAITVVGRLTGE